MPPYELVFDTSGLSGIATVDEAVAQDKWLRPGGSGYRFRRPTCSNPMI